MKTLKIPKSYYIDTDTTLISIDLKNMLATNTKREWHLTLYGAYKGIRLKKKHAALGDYIILSQCVNFFQDNDVHFTPREVRRCLNYFEDYNSKRVGYNKRLTAEVMG